MKISDYSYELPEERIAQFPPNVRGTSRLLVLNRENGAVSHKHYGDLVDFMEPGDVVVLNNTRVIKARLVASNAKDQPRELLLLEDHGHTQARERRVIYRGKIRVGEQLRVSEARITIMEILGGGIAKISSDTDILELAERAGEVPLPPYMHRQANESDTQRYQTIFADKAGSVAAPTASLNFTEALEQRLLEKGVLIAYLTLHVGLGTFLPIRADDIENHVMHSEYFEIPAQTVATIRGAKQKGRKILAVGTTVARTLEYAHKKILQTGAAIDLSGEADIFMYPGYSFKIVDELLTNFHAPKSTVLMLAAAFGGWKNLSHAYQLALADNYAFLSYGDSMLII